MFEDTYKTLQHESQGIYTEKGSKFIAFALPVTSEEEIKGKLAEIKKKYYDARHHCYAYILGPDKAIFRMNDDGEPSSTAGRPIYGQLLSHDITNVLIVVVRYFGGTKLGVPGLINAYRTAAKDAIETNRIIEKTIDETYEIRFDYVAMNSVMQILKHDGIKINGQSYEDRYILNFTLRRRDADRILEALRKIPGLKVKFLR